MRGINRIKLDNNLLMVKVNYFIDYFNYCIEVLGLTSDMDLENPLSVIEKAILQLKKNDKINRAFYLSNHFLKLRSTYSEYLASYSTFQNLRDLINGYESNERPKQKDAYISRQAKQLIKALSDVKSELKPKMVESSLKEVLSYIKCSHDLDTHKESLRFHCRIIASELLFKRKGRKEVGDVFSRIFTDDYRKFPYPNHIKSDIRRKRFFEKMDFNKRFNAILYFANSSQESSNIIYNIASLKLPLDYVFLHNGVTICSPQNKKLSHLKKSLLKLDREQLISEFFSDDSAFCIVPTKYHNLSIAHPEALAKGAVTVNFINAILNSTYSVKTKSYIYTNDFKNFGYHIKGDRSNQILTDLDIKRIEDNAYKLFHKKTPKSATNFLSFEPDFLKARVDRNIAQLWRYLEIMIGGGGETIKETLAAALLLNEKELRSRRMKIYLRGCIHPFIADYRDLNITAEHQKQYCNGTRKIELAANEINSQFFIDILKSANRRMNKGLYQDTYNFYKGILTEAQEQRNMIEHSGIYHEKAGIKLYHSFLDIIVRFRWVLFDYMRTSPKQTLQFVIKKAKIDGEKLKG